MARIVVALGGNALGNDAEEQQKMIDNAAPSLIALIKQKHEIILPRQWASGWHDQSGLR